VVFTDDDVDVDGMWLQEIAESTRAWPDHLVFGGRIDIVWPAVEIPGWASDVGIQHFAFTLHDHGPEAHVYGKSQLPFGPNYWVRRRLLDSPRKFAEHIGPHPTNRILGDETLFLMQLRKEGYEPVYVPTARVGHRIQPHILTAKGVRDRAWQLGRGIIHMQGLPQVELLKERRWRWALIRCRIILKQFLAQWAARFDPDPDERVRRAVYKRRELAYEIEALRVARENR